MTVGVAKNDEKHYGIETEKFLLPGIMLIIGLGVFIYGLARFNISMIIGGWLLTSGSAVLSHRYYDG